MRKLLFFAETAVMLGALLVAALGLRANIQFLNASLASTANMVAEVKDTAGRLKSFSKHVSLEGQLADLKSVNEKLLSIESALQSTKAVMPDVLQSEKTTLMKLRRQNVSLSRLNAKLLPLIIHLDEGTSQTQKLQSSMGTLNGILDKLSSSLASMSLTMDDLYKSLP